MSDASPTDRLVDHALDVSYDRLPDEVRVRLKQHLLDWFAVTVAGAEHAGSSPAVEAGVADLVGSSSGDATVVPTGERRPADAAALLNGTYAHSLDYDDTHRESSLHPGAPVVAAALAVAEREGASTERLLAAVSAGYDVACAVGRAVTPEAHYDRGFHITATCGTFGATAAAGAVAGLSREELAAAFGINGSQAAGSLQFLANGAWNKRLHPGLAARRAVTAVSLAAGGFRGAADPLAGEYGFLRGYTAEPDPAALDRVGETHAVLETGLKPYPCCRYAHPAIDGLLDLAREVEPDDVTAVRVALPRPGIRLTGDPIDAKRRPANFVDCQFSMPFATALALTRGDAGLEAFLDAQSALDAGRLRRLMDATDVETDEEVSARFPEQWTARVVVETGDRTRERFVETARGEPEKPLGWEGLVEKTRPLLGGDGAVEAVRDAEARSVSDLVAACSGAGPARE